MKRTNILLLLLSFALAACSGQTLDGGSGASGGDPGDGSSSGGGTGSEGTAVADGPVHGTIGGNPFAPQTIELQYSETNQQWFFSMRSYPSSCGAIEGDPPGPEGMIVTIGEVNPKAGTTDITYGDGHGATFQIGVFSSADLADVRSATTGTLRLDAWDGNAGATVHGAVKLVGEDSDVEGTFDARVCPPSS